jgi:His/Glu/Gln/Arg/opine family amino acid ABC transporter permease subunit
VDNFQYFLYGALITFLVSLIGWIIGLPLSLAIALIKVKKVPAIAPLLTIYVSLLRSLPLPLLVLLLYFGLPVWGLNLDPYVAGVISLALNTSSFNSEIWRGAILNFPHEQIDAARSVGMTNSQAFWRIVFPQIWRTNLPNFINEATFLIKASPAIGIIGIDDLTRRAGKLAASNYEPLPTLAMGMGMYIAILLAISFASRPIERYFQRKFQIT